MLLKVKLIEDKNRYAREPEYQTDGAACFDVFASIDTAVYIDPMKSIVVPLGFHIEVPKDFVMLLFSRSGHGVKGVRLGNCVGVIDSDFRGEVCAIVRNDSYDTVRVIPGDRIAQGMVLPIPAVDFKVVKELSHTERGEKKFGSTGG